MKEFVKSLTVRVREDEYRFITEQSERRGVRKATVVRELIRAEMAKVSGQVSEQVPGQVSGQPNVQPVERSGAQAGGA